MNSLESHKPKAISHQLFSEAKKYIPGGVNSPVRSFNAVGGYPVFVKRASGSRLYGECGREFIDYCLAFGVLILGHAHPGVIEALEKTIRDGTGFGTATRLETELAQEICGAMPSIELVRLVNSGAEAVMGAIRAARGYTRRDKVIKFDGCYHGGIDYLLAGAGQGGITLGIPNSLGVPRDFTKHTIVLSYNDLEVVKRVVEEEHQDLACIIVEPVAGNMGVVLPRTGFLEGLREICDRFGIVLIFDEVITGFRLSFGGGQQIFGLAADMTCLGKIIGGGLPIGAYGGRRDIMECVSPLGGVYQAGTFCGNPVSVSAGLATLKFLKFLKNNDVYDTLESRRISLCEGIEEAAEEYGIDVQINQIGSMFAVFFTEGEVINLETAKRTDTSKYARFFHSLLKEGVYLPPSNFEACFISISHTMEDIERTIEVIRVALKEGI